MKIKKIALIIFCLAIYLFTFSSFAKPVATCTATLNCGGGATISCTGTKHCKIGVYSVTCDDVTASCSG